jgi:hypothetical protein
MEAYRFEFTLCFETPQFGGRAVILLDGLRSRKCGTWERNMKEDCPDMTQECCSGQLYSALSGLVHTRTFCACWQNSWRGRLAIFLIGKNWLYSTRPICKIPRLLSLYILVENDSDIGFWCDVICTTDNCSCCLGVNLFIKCQHPLLLMSEYLSDYLLLCQSAW